MRSRFKNIQLYFISKSLNYSVESSLINQDDMDSVLKEISPFRHMCSSKQFYLKYILENQFIISFLSFFSQNKMRLLHQLKGIVKLADFFHSVQLLRYQRQNEYRTITGGCISLAIIVVIVVGFARMILDTINLSSISYSFKTQKQQIPSQTTFAAGYADNFMFGVQLTSMEGFNRINISQAHRYLTFRADVYEISSGEVQNIQNYGLEICTKQHWKSLPSVVQSFQKLEINNWLCPKLGQNLSLYGKFTSQKYSYLQFSASPCKNDTQTNETQCASEEQIDNFFKQNQQIFYFTIYFINTIINPDQPNYLSYYLQEKAYITFSRKVGVQTYLEFSDFEINTDQSIWPFSNLKNDIGFIVRGLPYQYPYFIYTNETKYFTFSLSKSDVKISYEREVQKISNVFSFMGGLIGAIVAVLFTINSFTNYSYQVSLAINLFEENAEAQRMQQKHEQIEKQNWVQIRRPHLLQYLKYNFYQMKKKVGVCFSVCPKMKKIQDYRREILSQLDISYIVKRLVFHEYCLRKILEKQEYLELHQGQPHGLEQIKKLREVIIEKSQRAKSTMKIDINFNDESQNQKQSQRNLCRLLGESMNSEKFNQIQELQNSSKIKMCTNNRITHFNELGERRKEKERQIKRQHKLSCNFLRIQQIENSGQSKQQAKSRKYLIEHKSEKKMDRQKQKVRFEDTPLQFVLKK